MADQFYEKTDLADFPNIGEHAPELANAFFAYYERAISAGKLSAREKALLAMRRHLPKNAHIVSMPLPKNV